MTDQEINSSSQSIQKGGVDKQDERHLSQEMNSPDDETVIIHPADEQEYSEADSYRSASYFVLFVATVFIINAMETGSYRITWPVAIGTLVVGLGLLGFSVIKKSKE
ncbi:MAG: hypothetical protein KKE17_05470 [Proteobacteria bacterium]|nr:hypothetical protein [Pseudomonadota bacterium]MBU1709440.1 hypothetical protein [Pseudomonadota bacterium]